MQTRKHVVCRCRPPTTPRTTVLGVILITALLGSWSVAQAGTSYYLDPVNGKDTYDGMAAIYEVAQKLGGKIDGDKAMAILKGWKRQSPRGPISIDPETRDIVQTVYIRKVEKRDGHYYNVEFEKFPEVKDPGK